MKITRKRGSDGSDHSHADDHAVVTLAADADTILSLSTQELGLDTQTANVILAGPETGAAADPTFRALVDADIPAVIARVGALPFEFYISFGDETTNGQAYAP